MWTGCSSIEPPRREVAYEEYEKIPVLPTSKVYRRLLKAIPVVRNQVFYGRYGGFGNLGGRPIDPLDDLFRKHDIVYYEANHYRAMVAADLALVEALENLDPSGLGPRAREFRERTIGYFGSPGARALGKPVTSGWPRPDRPTAFPNPEMIHRFLTDPAIKFPEPLPTGNAAPPPP